MITDLDHQLLHDGITLPKETTLYQIMINFKYFITEFIVSIFEGPKILVFLIQTQRIYEREKTLLKYTQLNEPHTWIFILHYHNQKQEFSHSSNPA